MGEGRGEGKKGNGKSGSFDYQVSYGYDPSGRIKTLSWNAGGKTDAATYEYLENSHLLSGMKTGSGLAASYSYEDHRNVKTAVSNSFGNTAVSTYTYEYDELGRRKSVKNSGSAFTNPNFNIYGYNDRSEVTAANSFTGEDLASKNNPLSDRDRAYNYDPIGNRKSATEAASNLTYTANSLNQYESISGGVNPETSAYDLDGNMTVSKGMVFSYNAENRLIEASPQNPQQGSVKATYIYDYMGRRAQKTLYTYSSGSWQKQKDISFIYDGWNMVKETVKSSDSSPEVPVYYVWGLDLSQSMQGAGGVGGLIASVKAGNEYLFYYDGNGNVGQMVKSTDGFIAARYEYDPFGKTIFSEGPMAGENPYRFSTKYLDGETGLYYYGFRYYDIELGRWINRNPLGENGGYNIYVFVRNNDINAIDLFGLAEDQKPAGPAPENLIGECNYYTWRVEDFEKRNKGTCYKPPTYYMSYGYKYCTRFRDVTRPVLSSKGKAWLDKTLVKLQEYMEEEIEKDKLIEYTDEKFTRMAFDTHPPAYWNAGFHGISIQDKLFVSASPDFEEWYGSSTSWQTWQQAVDMAIREATAYLKSPSDLTFDTAVALIDLIAAVRGHGPIDRLEREKERRGCQ